MFWASGEIIPLKDSAARPIGFVKVLRDQTEQHLAVEALREAEARRRRAQEAVGVGLFSLEIDTNTPGPTPEFCKIYGIEYADAVSISVIQALEVDGDQERASTPQSRKGGTSPLNVEYRIRRFDNDQKRVMVRRP